jgi:DNA-binding NarL/FixJ family response regulator
MANVNILLADGHDIVRRGLRSLTAEQSGWTVCGEARSGLDAVKLADRLHPDVVVLDLNLTELNGIEATRQIKRDRPKTEILLHTIHNEEYLISKAFAAGASGHVLKSEPEEILIEAVRTVARHVPFLSTRAAELLLNHVVKRGGLGKGRVLTSRENEIVQLLANGKSNKHIGAQLDLSVKTVEAHRSALMRKLGLKSLPELVRYAIRNGLIQP